MSSCSSEQACESCSQPESTWTLNPYPSYSSPNAYELTRPSWWDGTGPLEFLVQDLTKMKEKNHLKPTKTKPQHFKVEMVSCITVYSPSLSHAWRIHKRGTHLYVRRSLQNTNYLKEFIAWNLNQMTNATYILIHKLNK